MVFLPTTLRAFPRSTAVLSCPKLLPRWKQKVNRKKGKPTPEDRRGIAATWEDLLEAWSEKPAFGSPPLPHEYESRDSRESIPPTHVHKGSSRSNPSMSLRSEESLSPKPSYAPRATYSSKQRDGSYTAPLNLLKNSTRKDIISSDPGHSLPGERSKPAPRHRNPPPHSNTSSYVRTNSSSEKPSRKRIQRPCSSLSEAESSNHGR